MITRIVFAGGAEIEVPLHVEQVRDTLQQDGQTGQLSEFELVQRDRDGNPVRIYINRDQVAFIVGAELAQRPLEEQPEDESREDTSAAGSEAGRQQVTDVWGNPIRPRRRRR